MSVCGRCSFGVWGVVLVVCVCVSVSGLLFSVGVCVCDLFIYKTAFRVLQLRVREASLARYGLPGADGDSTLEKRDIYLYLYIGLLRGSDSLDVLD